MPKLRFLNVDLDMVFKKEPKTLLRELGQRVTVLYSGKHPKGHLVALELEWGSHANDPHKVLSEWIKLLGTLSPTARGEFDRALSRVFDLGFDVANQGKSDRVEMPHDLFTGLARLRTNYAITLYAAALHVQTVPPRTHSRS